MIRLSKTSAAIHNIKNFTLNRNIVSTAYGLNFDWRSGRPPCFHALSKQRKLPARPNVSATVNYVTACKLIAFSRKNGLLFISFPPPQWGTADTEIKDLSVENPELKAWSRSVYSHACYAYCQGFLRCQFLPFRFIHLPYFLSLSKTASEPFLCWLWLSVLVCRIK